MSNANDDPRDASAETKFTFPESWQTDTPGAFLRALGASSSSLIVHMYLGVCEMPAFREHLEREQMASVQPVRSASADTYA